MGSRILEGYILFFMMLGTVCTEAQGGFLSRLFGRGRREVLSGCNTGRCQPSVVRRRDSRRIVRDNRPRNVKRIPGQLRVGEATSGGRQVLVELDNLGRFRQSLSIQGGRLFGRLPLLRGTKEEVDQIFLQGLRDNQFQGRARNLVQNYINRQLGALASGKLPVDLNGVDPKIPGVDARTAMRKAINFLFNMLSVSNIPQPVPNVLGADGRGLIDTTPFLKIDQLALLVNANNPYSCTGTFRMDQLITSVVSDPDIYSQLAGVSKTLDDLSRQQGVSEDLIGGIDPTGAYAQESIVARGSRVLKRQTQRRNGFGFYESRDFITDPEGAKTHSNDKFGARNVAQNPLAFAHDAGEYIFFKDNGFLAFGLFGANGQRAQTAPTNIVKPRVQPPYDCLKCHQQGLRGGINPPPNDDPFSLRDLRPVIAQNPNLNSFEKQLALQFYDNGKYGQYNLQDNDLARRALIQADAFIPVTSRNKPIPGGEYGLLKQVAEQYGNDLTIEEAARELGTSVAALQGNAAFQAARIPALDTKGQRRPNTGKIGRKDFETLFCSLYRGPNRSQALFGAFGNSPLLRGSNFGRGDPRHNGGNGRVRNFPIR